MASYVGTRAKAKMMGLAGGGGLPIDLDGDTIRILLVRSTTGPDNTSVETEEDTEFVSGFTTLGELTDASYTGQGDASGRFNLAGKVINVDTANNEAEFDANDVTWTSLTADTAASNVNRVGGALVLKFITNDAGSPVLFFYDFSNVPVVGVNFTIQWAAEGLFKIT